MGQKVKSFSEVNLIKLGLNPGEVSTVLGLADEVTDLALGDSPDLYLTYQTLRDVLEGLNFFERLAERAKSPISYDEAKALVRKSAEDGKVIGITGKPAVGKTTLLNNLCSGDYIRIDECWPTSRDYKMALEILERYRLHQVGAIIAGCQLDPGLTDVRLHLNASLDSRFRHLFQRRRDVWDELRLEHYEEMDLVDTVYYGPEIVNADLVLDI